MTLDDLIHQTGEWLRGSGPKGEIVMSSRIRLARNLEGIQFSQWGNKTQRQEVRKRVEAAVKISKFLKGRYSVCDPTRCRYSRHLLLYLPRYEWQIHLRLSVC